MGLAGWRWRPRHRGMPWKYNIVFGETLGTGIDTVHIPYGDRGGGGGGGGGGGRGTHLTGGS